MAKASGTLRNIPLRFTKSAKNTVILKLSIGRDYLHQHSTGMIMNQEIGALERFLSVTEVDRVHPVSRSTRWRMVRAGTFPAPVKLSPGRIGWREVNVVEWRQTRRST